MSYPVSALLAGRSVPFRRGEHSAIAKTPVSGPVAVEWLGLAGDEQADREFHGGPEMAVHLYPADHYPHWRSVIGDHPLLAAPGAFGENIAASGLTEEIASIGDRFRLGTALLEISQPRQPCWKIEHHFGQRGMVADILKTGRCGMYFRVIEEGSAQAGDRLERVEGGETTWTVRRAFDALWGKPKAATRDELAELAALRTLAPKLRDKAQSRL